jgi:hypothetical protein
MSPREYLKWKSANKISRHSTKTPSVVNCNVPIDYKMVTLEDVKNGTIVCDTNPPSVFNLLSPKGVEFPNSYKFDSVGNISVCHHTKYHIHQIVTKCKSQIKKNGVVLKRTKNLVGQVFSRIDQTRVFTNESLDTHVKAITHDILRQLVNNDKTLAALKTRVDILATYIDRDTIKETFA